MVPSCSARIRPLIAHMAMHQDDPTLWIRICDEMLHFNLDLDFLASAMLCVPACIGNHESLRLFECHKVGNPIFRHMKRCNLSGWAFGKKEYLSRSFSCGRFATSSYTQRNFELGHRGYGTSTLVLPILPSRLSESLMLAS